MLKYLIQVVQNSPTTGVFLAMLFALSQLGGKQRQKRWLLWGLSAGVAATLLLAVLKSTAVLIGREYFNIGTLSVTILSEILFCMLLQGVLQKRPPELHERIWSALYAVLAASLLLYTPPDIFLYPTEFLMAGQSVFNTDFLYKSIGYLGGLLIVGFSGLALYQVETGLSFRLVRILLIIGLAVNMVKRIVTIVQFLLARRMAPMSRGLFEFIKMSVNYNDRLLCGIMVITILMPVLLWIKSLHPKDAFSNPAQHRRIRAVSRRQRRWCTVVLTGYLLSILCLIVARAYDEREAILPPAEPMNVIGSEIVIPLENVDDGHLHRFIYTASSDTEVRLIVIRKSANTNSYGVGLGACDICGPTGYYKRGDHEVACRLCDVIMNISTIGSKGGCNPIPLSYTIQAGNMVIQTNDLESEKKRFEQG